MMAHTSNVDRSQGHVSKIIAAMVMDKGFRDGSALINDECVKGGTEYLDCVLDVILNPDDNIDNSTNIDWCKWLIAGGRTPDEFAAIGEVIDIFVQPSATHAVCTRLMILFFYLSLFHSLCAFFSFSFALFLCVFLHLYDSFSLFVYFFFFVF